MRIGRPRNAGMAAVMLAAPLKTYAPSPSTTSTAPRVIVNLVTLVTEDPCVAWTSQRLPCVFYGLSKTVSADCEEPELRSHFCAEGHDQREVHVAGGGFEGTPPFMREFPDEPRDDRTDHHHAGTQQDGEPGDGQQWTRHRDDRRGGVAGTQGHRGDRPAPASDVEQRRPDHPLLGETPLDHIPVSHQEPERDRSTERRAHQERDHGDPPDDGAGR